MTTPKRNFRQVKVRVEGVSVPMYLLSATLHAEFVATPSLIRLATSSSEEVACLLIKTNSLELRYLVSCPQIDLRFFRASPDGDVLGYAIYLRHDDEPYFVWSVVEWEDELEALRFLTEGRSCKVFLFNEVAVNVAEATATAEVSDHLASVTADINLYRRPESRGSIPLETVNEAIQGISEGVAESKSSAKVLVATGEWRDLRTMYITDKSVKVPLALFARNEGAEQEQLATWLIDHLQPAGSVRSPQVLTGSKHRELTDLLLFDGERYVLIESKALAILDRAIPPPRAKLRSDIEKGAHKAVRQLRGAVRSIRRSLTILDSNGASLNLPQDPAPHAIILVPDLSLLRGATDFGGAALRRMAIEDHVFFQFLDPKELLRVVQAGELIVESSTETASELEAVDDYLTRRFRIALQREDPDFEVIAR